MSDVSTGLSRVWDPRILSHTPETETKIKNKFTNNIEYQVKCIKMSVNVGCIKYVCSFKSLQKSIKITIVIIAKNLMISFVSKVPPPPPFLFIFFLSLKKGGGGQN